MTTPKRGGLGRGLGALIPTGPAAVEAGARFAELPIDAIVPNRVQPRQVFDEVFQRQRSTGFTDGGAQADQHAE